MKSMSAHLRMEIVNWRLEIEKKEIMRVAIMQPYFMPYLGYFQAIAAVDKYILYDQVSFIVHGWVNRNRIRQRNMPAMYISVPIAQKSSYELDRKSVV